MGQFEKQFRRQQCPVGRSWRVDETYVKNKGKWAYLYRAVDKDGQTADFLLTPNRNGNNILDTPEEGGYGSITGLPCSPIEDLAKTLLLSQWEDARFAMFTAAFDASGAEHDQTAVVVAGFISSTNDWLDFERQWSARLSQEGVKYFHAVEFAHSRGQFYGWEKQEDRRRAFLSDLVDIIRHYCYRKFGCGISVKQWRTRISQANKDHYKINVFCQAAMIVAANVENWALSERIKTPIEIVFEDGDTGKRILQRYLSTRKPDPLFRPKQDTLLPNGTILPGFVPLQAADFLAYELLLGIRNYESGMPREPRFAIREFHDMPGEIRYLDAKDFVNLDAMLRTIPGLLGNAILIPSKD